MISVPSVRSRAPRRRLKSWRVLAGAFGLVVSTVYLLPLIWVASLSVRTSNDIYGDPVIPHSFRISNYIDAWRGFGLTTLYKNSVLITLGSVALGLTLAVPAGYGFARYRSRLKDTAFVMIVAELAVPSVAILLPFFLTMKAIGLYNSLFAVVIAETAFLLPFGIFVLRAYVEKIPAELLDAARVDGATEWRSFFHVVLPLLRPAIATVAIFFTLGVWNGFLLPLVLIQNNSSSTLMVGLSVHSSDFFGTDWGLVSAGVMMATMPLLVLFIAARRFYVQGLSAGALRG